MSVLVNNVKTEHPLASHANFSYSKFTSETTKITVTSSYFNQRKLRM